MSLIFQKPPFNYQYKVGIANAVDVETVPVQQDAPVTDGVMQDVVLPGRAFAQDGQRFRAIGIGTLDNPTGTAIFNVTVNGVLVGVGTVGLAVPQRGFKIEVELFRQAANLRVVTTFNMGILSGSAPVVNQAFSTLAAFNFSQPVTVVFRFSSSTPPDTATQVLSFADIE